MGYIDKFLAPGEHVRARAELHWILWVRAWAALLLLGVFLIGIVIFVQQVVFMLTTELAATDRRLILKKGLLVRNVRDVGLDNIESVHISQDVFGRLLNYGRLSVHGTGDEAWTTPIIADPSGFRRDIEAATPKVG
ncbi:MAG: PH domain-containing protein [Hyphomonadaceae bacterium]|nr:PH domain-containing protein [Hyphomonadaceae bacterium]